MLQRLASSLATVVKLPLARTRRMPTKSKQSAIGAEELQTTGLQAVARSGVASSSPPLPRRSSRPRSTLQSSAVLVKAAKATSSLEAPRVVQTVKQESSDSAQPAVAALIAAPVQTKPDTAPSRKRKAAAHAGADATGLDPALPVLGDSHPAFSKAAVPLKDSKRRARASTKIQPAQPTGTPSVPQADPPPPTGAAGPALQQPADSPARPSKQRKPRAKAVVKEKPTTVIQSPDNIASGPTVAPEDSDVIATQTSSAKKVRRQKSTRVKVEVRNVEPANSPATAQDSAVVSDDSATPKKPRKRRTKVEVSVETLLESVHVTPYRERIVPKKWVGAHVSMGGGMERAVVRAAAIGANAFALDTRSKRQWESKPMSVETADSFKQACKDYGFGPDHILPHGSYLINLASAKPELLQKSYTAFVDELKRCEMLGIGLYNFHPGSTCGECPAEEGLARIAESINKAHAETESVIIVLENMAGGGGSVGHRFDYLRYIIDRVQNKARVGVCLDTCHLFAGGYDVSSTETFEQVMQEFEEVVGLQFLKGMHVNDSKAALGSKKDRHENVAKGLIGKECFEFLMNDSRFDGIPLIMETPVQCHGPDIDYKLSLLAGAPVFKSPKPGEEEAEENTDKRDIAWLNSLSRA